MNFLQTFIFFLLNANKVFGKYPKNSKSDPKDQLDIKYQLTKGEPNVLWNRLCNRLTQMMLNGDVAQKDRLDLDIIYPNTEYLHHTYDDFVMMMIKSAENDVTIRFSPPERSQK